MKTTKNIARLAVTAGLTVALSFGGVMAPVTMAFADEGATVPDNSITITQDKNNGYTRFRAYQIFKADVADPTEEGTTDKIVSNVKWADGAGDDAQKAIITAIKNSAGYDASKNKLPDTGVTPQDVADWLTANITKTDKSTVVGKDDLLNKIAGIVKDKVDPAGDSFSADYAFAAPSNGYYLFLTDTESIGTKENYSGYKQTGTSPIFAVVGGKAVTVTEKTNIPTVMKQVKDDKPGSVWADKADSQVGQDVQYKLTGTVASNIATFNNYYYQFHDTLSAGLTAKQDSVEITIYKDKNDSAGTVINPADNKYKVNYVNLADGTSLLTVTFDDLKSAVVDLTPDSQVVVTYTAQLVSEKAIVGGMGNDNTVKLIYSNNPMSDGRGESVPDTVRDYTYALQLVKEDFDDSNKKLQDVEFTIKATGADELAPDTEGAQFVQGDGSLGSDAHRFKTDSNGVISVKGLDAGAYTVEEVKTPDGYNTLPKFTFTIEAEGLDKNEGETLEGTSSPNTLKITRRASGSDLVSIDAVQADGTVTLTVKNKKGSSLPLTGLNGVTFTWIAGGAVLCIGVTHLIRSRKRDEGSEE